MGNDPILTLSQSVVLNLYTMVTINWHTPRDSNPDEQFWRLSCCHYIRDAYWPRVRESNPVTDFKSVY